jgi:hypothetical protein
MLEAATVEGPARLGFSSFAIRHRLSERWVDGGETRMQEEKMAPIYGMGANLFDRGLVRDIMTGYLDALTQAWANGADSS